jgi:hypothetical protein
MLARNILQKSQTLGLLKRSFGMHSQSKVTVSTGKSQTVSNNEDVELRGIHLKGKYDDLPTMLFFPQILDPAENWIKFFINPNNELLQHRSKFYPTQPYHFLLNH